MNPSEETRKDLEPAPPPCPECGGKREVSVFMRGLQPCPACTGQASPAPAVLEQEDFMDAVNASSLSNAQKTEWARVCIWEAINEYTAACGGDTSDATVSDRRMNAVVAVERAIARGKQWIN